MAGKPKFLYALYQGEELLCAGTMKELSDYTKQDIATLRQYLTPSYSNARRDYLTDPPRYFND